jgi:hypothetical protein
MCKQRVVSTNGQKYIFLHYFVAIEKVAHLMIDKVTVMLCRF